MTIRLGRRYEFPAAHRLYSHLLDDDQNRALFGKCANPYGHGHNYEFELDLRGEVDPVTGRAADLPALDTLVEREILSRFRHTNLNDLPPFRETVPTTENLAVEVLRGLQAAWPSEPSLGEVVLEKVRIWETERNICELAA